jgi:stage II sporulation protein D
MSQYGAYGFALHGYSYPAILAHYYRGTALAATNPRRIVRVLLNVGQASFSGANRAGKRKLSPKATYTVEALSDGSLVLVGPKGKALASFGGPFVVSGPGGLSLAGVGSYSGTFQFRSAGAGSVETINLVGLDAYVRGVVPVEMSSSWPAQALEAQAVAARTYALTSDADGGVYQLYSDTRSQSYGGIGAETARSDGAVQATRGQIVTYQGAPAATFFFASSGGYTESIQNAFAGSTPRPWLRGVPDPYDGAGGDPYHRWSYRMSMAAAQAKLAGLVKGSLIGIQILKHGVSPRILTAAVVGTAGRTTVSGTDLEQRFGLYSTWAKFTTISGTGGTVAKATRRAAPAGVDFSWLTAEIAGSLASALFAPRVPVIEGRVFPARGGARVAIQQLDRGRWHTTRLISLSAGGRYLYRVPRPGSYRVRFAGLPGPAVNVR